MEKTCLFLLIWLPLAVMGQVSVEWRDDFSDGNFTENPTWSGTNGNFVINSEAQLQSNASSGSHSYLSTPSEAFDDAVWEFWVRLNLNASANNYAIVYIVSDRADISGDVNGYYVQIGNTGDEVALYRQQGALRTRIIDGIDRIIDTNPVILHVRVTRTKDGVFTLSRKRVSNVSEFNDADFVQEGTPITDNYVKGSRFFGVMFVNSSTTGKAYFFDDISVKGAKFWDVVPPEWLGVRVEGEENNQLVLTFSEPIDIASAIFYVDNGIEEPVSAVLRENETTVVLTFANSFQKGVVYSVSIQNIKDLSGNLSLHTQKVTGVLEPAEPDDLVINEILFDNSEVAPEYFEIYNTSSKVLDLTNLFFAVKSASGKWIPNRVFPAASMLFPYGYMALTPDADLVRSAYSVPDTANIVKVHKWSALNNSSASFLVGNIASTVPNGKDTIVLDEVCYDTKWHHVLIRNPKGVALERINSAMPSQSASSWHSASSDVRYGTPGYKNSQYRPMQKAPIDDEKWFSSDPEAFTPDNDGRDDVCFIRYKTEAAGFVANVIIFNAIGEKVIQLAANQILGSEGYLIWDGKTDRGMNVNSGIYVLYVELVNLSSGMKKVEKMPLVVAAR